MIRMFVIVPIAVVFSFVAMVAWARVTRSPMLAGRPVATGVFSVAMLASWLVNRNLDADAALFSLMFAFGAALSTVVQLFMKNRVAS